MSKLITFAVFDNSFEIKFNLLKDMLDEAGINYITNNEFARTVKPLPYASPTNMAVEIKVYEEDLPEAIKILNSIK